MSRQTPKILGLLNGYSSHMSGGDWHFIKLINQFSRSVREVTICLPDRVYTDHLSKKIKRCYYSRPAWEEKLYHSNFALFFIYLKRLYRSIGLVRSQNFDVLILASHLFFDSSVLPFINLKGRLAVVFVHHLVGEQSRHGLHRIITGSLEKISLAFIRQRSVLVFTVSPRVRQLLIKKYGLKPELIINSANGIDLAAIDHVPPGRRRYDLVYCGRLNQTKGVYDLVKIVSRLKLTRPKISLAVVGGGPEERKLAELIKQNQLIENIFLLGPVDNRAKFAVMKSARIFTLASHEEGWGIVIGEAMACGTPVVCYRLPDITSIWGQRVRWSDCFNISQFAEHVEQLLTDKKLYRQQQKKGLNFIQSFSWQNVIHFEIDKISKKLINIKS